jgi:hypothetical protein
MRITLMRKPLWVDVIMRGDARTENVIRNGRGEDEVQFLSFSQQEKRGKQLTKKRARQSFITCGSSLANIPSDIPSKSETAKSSYFGNALEIVEGC